MMNFILACFITVGTWLGILSIMIIEYEIRIHKLEMEIIKNKE